MKRLAAIILSALILFSFAACDFFNDSPEESESSISTDGDESFTPNESESSISTDSDDTSNNIDDTTSPETDKSTNKSPELSKDDILDSVSTLIDHDILYEEEFPRCYNFISETTGYFFQFKFFGAENRLVYLLKTEDGGKTWAAQDIQIPSSMGWREHIVCAKMLDENVGLISGLYGPDENFSNRTYITTDKGKTWTKIILPKDAPHVISKRSSDLATYLEGEAYDLTQENGVYYLHVRVSAPEHYHYLRYSSTDLVNWTFVEYTK